MSSWILYILHTFIITRITSGVSENIELNNKCNYSANKRILSCVGLEHMDKNLASFITPGTQMLFIRESQNVVFQINHHVNPNYRNLVSYQILNCQIFRASQGTFLGLSNLKYMEIHGNVWHLIEANTFIGLSSLEMLNLARNQIKKLNTDAFSSLSELKILDLSQNCLEIIPAYIFEDLNKLNTLTINNNLIRTIEDNAFLGLPNLRLMVLTNNSLGHINAVEFNKLKKLDHLDINFNQVESVDGKFILPELNFLQIANNTLTNLNSDIFERCSNLQSVDLSNNDLRSLTEAPFLNLSRLRHLNLYNNFVDLSKFSTLRVNTIIIHN